MSSPYTLVYTRTTYVLTIYTDISPMLTNRMLYFLLSDISKTVLLQTTIKI